MCVVTDWRFANELHCTNDMFTNVITARVYRKDVPEPPINLESEHSLDNYVTDYLLLSSPDEFNDTVKKYPQYAEYTYSEYI